MKLLEKRCKFRIYPTTEQEVQIQKNFGCCRFVYNFFLAKQIERYKAGEGYLGLYDTCKELPALKRTEGYEWLKEADSASMTYALCDLDMAYKNFFKNVKKGDTAPGFPRFKSKKDKNKSYRCKNKAGRQAGHHSSIELGERQVKLPKLGWIECRGTRQTEGRILNASVIQSASGKYYASVYFTDVTPAPLSQAGKSVGLHFGVRNLAVTSYGEQFENRRYLEQSRKKIIRLQRRLSRKSSGGRNREKARIRLAKVFERVSNQKADMLHKLTTKLVREYDIICVRDEPIREMHRNKTFAKYLADANWSELLRKLAYKCEWYGKTLVKVDKLSPSAQLCSSCGYRNARLKPYQYEWICPECGVRHDRGQNAAVNILNEGKRLAADSSLISPGVVRSGGPEVMSAESA